jgi:hypothetical protein
VKEGKQQKPTVRPKTQSTQDLNIPFLAITNSVDHLAQWCGFDNLLVLVGFGLTHGSTEDDPAPAGKIVD